MSSTKRARNPTSRAPSPPPSTTSQKMNLARWIWLRHLVLLPPTLLWWRWKDAHPSSSWTGKNQTMTPPVWRSAASDQVWIPLTPGPEFAVLPTEYEVISTAKGPDGEQVSVLTTNQTHTAVENLKPESRCVCCNFPKQSYSGPKTGSNQTWGAECKTFHSQLISLHINLICEYKC